MKIADYSDEVTGAQLDFALRAGGFEAVMHYLGGAIARRIEDPAVVADIRARGWPQMGIDVPRLQTVDGAAFAARVRSVYGFGDGFGVWLDIEPSEFDADPAGWAAAADRWCDACRAAGLSPGPYGVDRTVAACAGRADRIWRAVPGECDPAAVGPQGLNPAFFAGRRAIQCGAGTWGGIPFDISFSQFTVGGGPMTGSFPAVDVAEAFVDAMYQADGHRPAESNDARQNWVKFALAHGLQATVEAMAASPEFATNNADLLLMLADYRAGKLGGQPASDLPKVADALQAAATQLRS